MDIMSTPLQARPNEPPVQFYMSLVAPAEELTALRDAIERALVGGPAIVEFRNSQGIACRMVIDRTGPPGAMAQ